MSDEQLQDENEAQEAAKQETELTGEEVQTQAHETYAGWWEKLKGFAMKHRETPTSTPQTVGQMVLEFIEKCESGAPLD